MAKLSVALLFLFFTISAARSLLSKPENDVTADKLLRSDAKSDLADAIRVPGDANRKQTNTIDSENKVAVNEVMPLNLVRIPSINRHFWLRSILPFRVCGHQFRHGRNPRPIVSSGVEIPFGNDMILSSANNNGPHVPLEWTPFLHQHAHRHHRGDDAEKLGEFMPKHHHGFDHWKTKNNYHDNEGAKKERKNSLWNRIIKFMGEYLN